MVRLSIGLVFLSELQDTRFTKILEDPREGADNEGTGDRWRDRRARAGAWAGAGRDRRERFRTGRAAYGRTARLSGWYRPGRKPGAARAAAEGPVQHVRGHQSA